jgi:hypothetical protein
MARRHPSPGGRRQLEIGRQFSLAEDEFVAAHMLTRRQMMHARQAFNLPDFGPTRPF